MIKKVVIIDYGMGNLSSVVKALNYLKIPNCISNQKKNIDEADFLILPGVGSFKQGIENLKQLGLVDILDQEVMVNQKPILGICLGMQLFAKLGTEPTNCEGLGWIEGEVIKMKEDTLRVPHLGWNSINIKNENFIEFDQKDFYFIHSYHFNVVDKSKILATINYGSEYVAAIQSNNIIATQFHPEKSQFAGLKLMKHILELYA